MGLNRQLEMGLEIDLESSRQASSATTGFFQSYPTISPAYTSLLSRYSGQVTASDDAVFANVLRLYLPDPLPATLDRSIHEFARTCLDSRTLRLMVDCETNLPTLHLLSTFGEVNDVNPLRTSEGWRGLKDIQTRTGIVAHGYHAVSDRQGSRLPPYNFRIYQFALAHLWSPSCASVSCPAAMSDGAAMLIAKHISQPASSSALGQDAVILRRVLKEVFARLTSFDPSYAWTSGQWMTERPGGSDVSRTETLAHLASTAEIDAEKALYGAADVDSVGMPLGPYFINGFKWFSSATDADMAVLLARTPKGLTAFLAPMKRSRAVQDGRSTIVMNGVRISRLKNKLGTKGLPTAELEIRGMRAWMLGEEGKGVREISAILNATRLWTASGATGGWGRGLAVARAYSKVRKIKGERLLMENAQHVQWMAGETLKYRASLHFAFFGVALLGISELGWEQACKATKAGQWLPKDKRQAELLLRILTPVMKAQCSLSATLGLRECMESLGGVGYCENLEDDGVMNIARLFRDSSVNSIWEGTTNILAEDFVRGVKGRDGLEAVEALDKLLERIFNMDQAENLSSAQILRQKWQTIKALMTTTETDALLYQGRELLVVMQDITCAALLMVDAVSTQAKTERIVADRWISLKFSGGKSRLGGDAALAVPDVEKDRHIFLGMSEVDRRDTQARL